MKNEYTTIRINQSDYKKLCDYKIHPNQSISEVVKQLLKGEQEGLKQALSASDSKEGEKQ